MSRADDYRMAMMAARGKSIVTARWKNRAGEEVLSTGVTANGDLELGSQVLSARTALELGRWLLDVFGDKEA